MALDDLQLFVDKCYDQPVTPLPGSTFNCGDGTNVLESQVCDFVRDCANGMDEMVCADCNFENSTCQWEDVSSGALEWTRIQAGKSINGPVVDNTLKTAYGYYVYLDATSGGSYQWASLELTRELKSCSSGCEVEFYYHMFGDTDTLGVRLF
jgi:hypothetical protein